MMQSTASPSATNGEEFQEADPRLLEVLASLNRIGATINQIGPRDSASMAARLGQIVRAQPSA